MPRRKIYKIDKINAREILDSRGNPTVEAEVCLDTGNRFKASIPSGASVGKHEAVELRDIDKKRYAGKGVLKACENIKNRISKELHGMDIIKQQEIDKKIIELDGTSNKSKLGANATLAVSLACARAGSWVVGLEVYEYINKIYQMPAENYRLPVPMFNIFNGGKHADTNLDLQEFMIVPLLEADFAEKIRIGAEIFHKLGEVLHKNYLDTDVGNEGGYAPNISSTIQAFDLILEAIKEAGYQAGQEIGIALDVGASELYNPEKKLYIFELDDHFMLADQLIALYRDWAQKYPIFSIEDGLAEDDWQGWANLSKEFERFKPQCKLPNANSKMLLVADDLVTTNISRLKMAHKKGVANAVIAKPNQIGTLSETMRFIKYAQKHNYKIITSHRSGETCDTLIADLAVAVNSDFCKFGSLSRGERVAKWNRLMEIENLLKH